MFEIVVNPDKLELNNGDPITVTDQLKITSATGRGVILSDSVQITLDPTTTEPNATSYVFSDDHTAMTLTIPDEHKATITYKVKFYSKQNTIGYENSVGTSGNFTISDGKNDLNLHQSNTGSATTYEFTLVKQDVQKTTYLENATFRLLYTEDNGKTYIPVKNGNEPVTFTTDANGKVIIKSENSNMWALNGGWHYRLEEIKAPDGYKTCKPIDFTIVTSEMADVPADGVYNGWEFYVYDEKNDVVTHPVEITKVDADTDTELAGATLRVTDKATMSTMAEWTTDGKSHTMELPAGIYTLTEITPPTGYDAAKPIDFEVGSDGTVKVNGDVTNVVKMKDTRVTKVTVSKLASDTGEALEGAVLQIIQDGKVIQQWTTGTESVSFNLPAGIYTLHEVSAPKQPNVYKELETDIEFEIDGDGNITITKGSAIAGNKASNGKFELKDLRVFNVPVKKTASDTKAALPGAQLEIWDVNHTRMLDSWTTTDTTHTVKLTEGTYTLYETFAPSGYLPATKITFTVNSDGTFQIGDDKVASINMVDTLIIGSVSIRKVDAADGKDLSDAHLVITDASNKIIAKWDTNGAEHPIENLKPGSYTLTEIKAPDGYDVAKEIHFEVDTDGKVYITDTNPKTLVGEDGIVMKDAKMPVTPTEYNVVIRKVGSDKTDANLSGATLEVKKEDGTLVDQWITGNTERTLKLEPGNYTLSETNAPEGYDVAADIKFTVTTDGKVTINDEEVKNLTVTMTDKKKQTSTPTPTPVVTPTPTPNTTTPTPTPAPTPKPTPVETPTPTATPAAPQQPATTIPRTADDYPLIPLVVAFLASGAALTLGLGKKRKRHN